MKWHKFPGARYIYGYLFYGYPILDVEDEDFVLFLYKATPGIYKRIAGVFDVSEIMMKKLYNEK